MCQLSYFNQNLILSQNFSKTPKYNLPWKFIQWELSCFMWTDSWMERWPDILIGVFHSCQSAYNCNDVAGYYSSTLH
jgi:hypothetical protein